MTLKEQVGLTASKLQVGGKVKFLKDGKPIKYGVAVQVGDWGCRIFNPKNKTNKGEDYDVSPDTAEWYPYKSFNNGKLDGGVIMI